MLNRPRRLLPPRPHRIAAVCGGAQPPGFCRRVRSFLFGSAARHGAAVGLVAPHPDGYSTHSYSYYATRFLWPLSDYSFDGVAWWTPWLLWCTYGSLALVFLLMCEWLAVLFFPLVEGAGRAPSIMYNAPHEAVWTRVAS